MNIEFYTKEKLKRIIEDKEVYIYAVNLEGMGACKQLTKQGYNIKGFIDSRHFDNNRKLGLPVISPDVFFNDRDFKNIFILIATKHRHTKKNILALFDDLGFKKGEDFLIITELCDYLPTIEVVGTCNLKCISCEMGLPKPSRTGFMSPNNYRKVLEKMTSEILFMNSVCLYLWGEPFLHPKLPEILHITSEFGLAADISTNLNCARYLEEIVKAGPDMLTVPCSGIRKNYEMTHTNGNWDVFEENLHLLRKYIDKHRVDLPVRVVYHMYKHNLDEDYSYMEDVAKKLNFYFFPVLANIFPGKIYDYVVDGKPIPPSMIEANKMLIIPIEEQLEMSYEKRNLPCPAIKAFPNVRSDNSILHCCNMTRQLGDFNYLETSLEELVQYRNKEDLCKECKTKGIHRFFDINAKVEVVDGKRVVQRF